jgi:hypothetical protein
MLYARVASMSVCLRFLNFPQRKIQYFGGMICKPLNLHIHSLHICEVLMF